MDDSFDRRQGEVARAFAALVGLEPEDRREEVEALKRRDPELASQVEERLVAFGMASAAGQEEWVDPLLGVRVSHYRIEARVGAGGMGVVYRALDEPLERMVALKFLPGHLARDPSLNRRFLNEAKAASALEHENICVVHELEWTADGRAFLVMPFYEGEPLSAKLERGPLAVDEAVAIARQMASGLAAAHAAGIIHRDVKPSNVMVTPGGKVKVLDFGLAKAVGVALTASGMTVGTVAYASPEQLRGEEVDERADVWSLGVVLYEMLTGRRAFERDTPTSTTGAVLHGEVEPIASIRPEVPGPVCRVVDGCLRRDRNERIGRMEEVGERLKKSVESVESKESGESGEANGGRANPRDLSSRAQRSGDPGSQTRRAGERGNWAMWPIVAGLLLAAALGISWWWWMGRDVTPAGEDEPVTMAVLPFRGYGSDVELGTTAEELSEGLAAKLQKIAGIRVVPYRSVLPHREANVSVAELARRMGVQFVVDGSVRVTGDDIRIAVDLVEGRSEVSLWSDVLESGRATLAAAEDQVVGAVVEALGPLLGGTEETYALGGHQPDPVARQLFVRGSLLRAEDETENYGEKIDRVMELYRAANRIDPGFAEPLAEMAYLNLYRAWLNRIPWTQAIDSARWLVDRAYAIDPDNVVVLTHLGIIQQFEAFDWPAAEEAFRRAIRIAPENSEARVEFAVCLARMGRADEAVAQAKIAVETDPYSVHAHSVLISVYLGARRFEDVIAAVGRIREVYPRESMRGTVFLARAYAGLGQFKRAGEILRQAGYLDEEVTDWRQGIDSGYIPYVMAKAGYIEEVRAMASAAGAKWRSDPDQFSTHYYVTALAYFGLGEWDLAFEWLERGFAVVPIPLLAWDPEWVDVRDHPRFMALLAQMNLPVEK